MTQYSQAFLDKLSLSRPGSRLIEIVPCAVPAYLVKAEVLLLEQRPVGPVEEFALKAIDQGFVVPAEVAGILGLEEALVIETLAGLQREELVHQVISGGMRELRLTPQGAQVLESRLREAPARTEVRIGFDRLIWSVSAAVQGHLLRRGEVESLGLKELRPRQKRRVRIDDLNIDDIEREVRALRGRGTKSTVLAVESIVRVETFFLEADVAIFEPADGGQPQLSVLIDRRPSEIHESSLETLGGLGYMEAELVEPAPDPKQVLTRDYGSEIAGQLAAQAVTLQEREERRIARVEALKDDDRSDDERESSPVLEPIPTVEFIDTFEHREYLQRALRSASRRLVIISPWITASVVNTGFLESLGQLLRKGVRVHIGYGLEERPDDRPKSKADKNAEEALQALSQRFGNFTFVKLGNTHSKQLLFDDTHVCGSFNWLSFVGDRRRTYRHEESTVVRRQDLVYQKYADLCERLDRAGDEK